MRIKKLAKKIRLRTWIALALIGILAPIVVLAVYEVAAEPDPPVAYWGFNEGSDNSCPNGTDDACDASANGNHLANTGSTWQPAEACVSGNCILLDGTDYLEGIDSTSLSVTGDLTFSAWIKPTELTAATLYLISGKTDGSSVDYALTLYGDEVRVYIGSSSNYETTDSANLTTSKFYQVNAVYDASAQTVDIYIDGALQASTTTGTIPASISNTALGMALGNINPGGGTFNYEVQADSDDGFSYCDNANCTPAATSWLTNYANNDYMGADPDNYEIFAARFTGVGIEQGANIQSATYSLVAVSADSPTSYDGYLRAQNVDDASAPSSSNKPHDWIASSLTTASTNFDPAAWVADTRYTISATSIVQELVDRAGWVSGNDMNFIVYDRGTTPSGVSLRAYDRAAGDTTNAELTITLATNSTIFTSYEGYLDELKIYGYGRSANEIKTDLIKSSGISGAAASFGTLDYSFLNKNLVGYWKLDEGSWNGTSSEVVDSQTPTYHGVRVADATTTTASKYGRAGTFDGTGDMVSIADNAALDLTQNVTISAWVNATSLGGYHRVVAKMGSGESTGYMLDAVAGTAALRLRIDTTDCNTSSNIISTGRWYHVAATYDGSAMRIFVDGAEVKSCTRDGTISTNNEVLAIGNRSDDNSPWNGKIDDVRLYNRALSSSEIQKIYSWSPDPIAHWRLDENSGTTIAHDSSGNTNDGAMANFATTDWVNGKYGSALNFDGSDNAINMYSSGFGSDFNYNNGSISGWVKVKNAAVWTDGTYRNIFNVTPNNTDRFEIAKNTGNNALRVYFRTNGADIIATDYTYSGTDWFHVALTWDNQNGLIKFYVNGNNVVSATGAYTAWSSAIIDAWTTIGSVRSDAPGQVWNGSIDDVRVYNYARSAGQITEDMNGGHPLGGSPIGSQKIYWKLDEAQGATAYNDVDLGADGTITSALWKTKVNCKINNCLSFDGTSDRVSIATASDADVDFNGSEQFTASAWVYITTMPGSGEKDAIIAKWDDLNGAKSYRLFVENDDADTTGNFQADLVDEGTVGDPTITATTANDTVIQNTWYHVAFTFNGGSSGAAGDLKLYVNGVPTSNSANASFATLDDVTSDFTVGDYDADDNTSGLNSFTGYIDEVKVYADDLTQAQILIDKNANAAADIGAASADEASQIIDGAGNPPLGYWKFDENTGSTSTFDSSGNGNTGTLTGSMTEQDWRPGKFGTALDFDGSDDVVNVGNPAGLANLGTLTVSAWVKSSLAALNNDRIVDKQLSNTNGWNLIISSSERVRFTVDCDGGTDLQVNGSVISWQNTWIHITATWDGTCTSSNPVQIYINGVADAVTVTAGTGNPTDDSGTSIGIGRRISSAASPFTGLIDEVKIYDYIRTPAQVAYDYNRGGPIGQWKMDECSGTAINDSSGKGLTGTATIGATGTQTAAGTCSTSGAWFNGASGKFNSSLNFDGTDDYITITDTNNIAHLTSNLSFGGWFKTSASGSQRVLLSEGTTNDYLYSIYLDSDDKIYCKLYQANSTAAYLETGSGKVVNDGSWHHIMCAVSGNTITAYVDGKLATTSSTTTGTKDVSTAGPLYIGSFMLTTLIIHWSGQIDDVRVYNYDLSAAQVTKLYNDNSNIRFGPSSGTP